MLGTDDDAATHLFAVLVCDDRAFGCARVCAENDTILEQSANDGGTGARRLGQRQPFLCQEMVAVERYRTLISLHRERTHRTEFEKLNADGLCTVSIVAVVGVEYK